MRTMNAFALIAVLWAVTIAVFAASASTEAAPSDDGQRSDGTVLYEASHVVTSNWTAGAALPGQRFAVFFHAADWPGEGSDGMRFLDERVGDPVRTLLSRGTHAVLLANLGEARTGGYGIHIARVVARAGGGTADGEETLPVVTVDVVRRRPDPGDFVIQAFTYPRDVVPLPIHRLPDTPYYVHFVDEEGDGLRTFRVEQSGGRFIALPSSSPPPPAASATGPPPAAGAPPKSDGEDGLPSAAGDERSSEAGPDLVSRWHPRDGGVPPGRPRPVSPAPAASAVGTAEGFAAYVAAPDEATLVVHVIARGDDEDGARQAAADRVQQIVAAAAPFGVEEEDVDVGTYGTRNQAPDGGDGILTRGEKVVETELRLRLRRAETLTDVIAVLRRHADRELFSNVGGAGHHLLTVEFALRDTAALYRRLYDAAVADARARAEAIAAAAGRSVADILSIDDATGALSPLQEVVPFGTGFTAPEASFPVAAQVRLTFTMGPPTER